MFRLMLVRHGCRTMLRDEAAKDPRKISFFREEWPFQDERMLINHYIEAFKSVVSPTIQTKQPNQSCDPASTFRACTLRGVICCKASQTQSFKPSARPGWGCQWIRKKTLLDASRSRSRDPLRVRVRELKKPWYPSWYPTPRGTR